jgi:hypothetical protein
VDYGQVLVSLRVTRAFSTPFAGCCGVELEPVDHDWKKGGQRKGKLGIFLPVKLYFPVVEGLQMKC